MKAPQDESPVGMSKWDLDTPALCVDLDKLEANITKMQGELALRGLGCRPHAKTHKCAAIARLQLEAGALGICTSKVSEAEALTAAGIDRICMTTANPAPSKIQRAMEVRRRSPHFIQAVDEEQNARDLSAAAVAAGVVADVVIDVAVGTRSGIPPGDGAVALAKLVDTLPGLTMRGILSYDGDVQHTVDFEERRERALRGIEANVRTFEAMAAVGLNTEIFSGGGTGTYDICHEIPGFTDVQAGSYVFVDMQYRGIGSRHGPVFSDFATSLTVMTTVLNNRFAGRLTTDAGAKAVTLDVPNAGVIGEPGMEYIPDSDEFGIITFTESSHDYKIGDRLELIPPHCDPVVNLYDRIYGIRNDFVEVEWPVTARGRSQ